MTAQAPLSIIVSHAKNRVIGLGGRVPWRLKTDLLHLRAMTRDKVVITGRKTYESMAGYYDRSGRDMPAARYIVVTSKNDFASSRQNFAVVTSISDAINTARDLSKDEIMIIGGATVYEETMPLVDRLYITEVNAEPEGDTYFTTLNPNDWQEVSRESHSKDADNEYDFTFIVLERR